MAEHTTVTPSGFKIVFEDGEPDPVTQKSKRRSYLIDGQKLPSVTTVLGMLDKPGLMWWSERLAVEGCIELARRGGLPLNPDAALGQLTRNGLRHFQVSEQKADRGHLSHDDLVQFAAGRKLPDLDTYAADQRGFIQGVAGFLADYRPRIVESELMVASVKHGFAGRLDSLGELGIKTQPNGLPAPKGLGQIDLKSHDKLPRTKAGTLKTPYPEHLLQVGLYDVGARESGYPQAQWRAILRVDQEGNYDFTVSWIEPDRCLALLPAYSLFKDAASRVKQPTDTVPVGLGLEPVAA
jgi:hypothetical protein